MKKLNEVELEEIVGGAFPSIEQICQITGWASAVMNKLEPGTPEFYIIANLEYDGCIENAYGF
jgi:hypothetical protein